VHHGAILPAQEQPEYDQLWGRRSDLGKVRTGLSVSLDGFIAGPNDTPEAPMGVGGDRLLAWYGAGDTEYRMPGSDMVFMVSPQTAEYLEETRRTTGALVFGRRTFDLTNGWGGKHPLDVPVFVVSSSVVQDWVYEGSPFTFVTDGLESAVAQAKAFAGDKDVGVGAAGIVQSCFKAGLLDEIHIDLVPVLLGGGVSLFDHLGIGPIDLEATGVVQGTGVTHLTFRVIR
jgi:dihydrofolate reductase